MEVFVVQCLYLLGVQLFDLVGFDLHLFELEEFLTLFSLLVKVPVLVCSVHLHLMGQVVLNVVQLGHQLVLLVGILLVFDAFAKLVFLLLKLPLLLTLVDLFIDLSLGAIQFFFFLHLELGLVDLDVVFFHLRELVLEANELVVERVSELLLLNGGVLVENSCGAALLSVDLGFVGVHVDFQLVDLVFQLFNILVHPLHLRLKVLLLTGFKHLLKLGFLSLLLFSEVRFNVLESVAHLFKELLLLGGVLGSLDLLKVVLTHGADLLILLFV